MTLFWQTQNDDAPAEYNELIDILNVGFMLLTRLAEERKGSVKMTKQAFKNLLNSCSYDDQPILEINEYWLDIRLIFSPSWSQWECGQKFYDQRQRIDGTRDPVTGADERLKSKFQKYNTWLDQWYREHRPGQHHSKTGEYMTKLRAVGYDEESVMRYVKRNPWHRE